MNWLINPKICTIFGVPLHIHITFTLFFLAMAVLFPGQILSLIIIFLSVIAHEYGHVLAGRYCDIGTKYVVLTPLGGIAFLDRIPQDPNKEIIITGAGPLVSLILCLWCGALSIVTFNITSIFLIGCVGNGVLFLFNMLPVFPMDGGRLLRAFLHYWYTYTKSTLISARVGQVMAGLIGLAGLATGNFLLPITMVMVGLMAEQEVRNARKIEANKKKDEIIT